MPYTAQHKQATRQRILESARRLFNDKGFAQVSIDEVMDRAGLTHGGFYRHFRDKSELYAEAVRWFLCAEAPKPWQERRDASRKRQAERVVDAYFSRDHFSDRESCCPLLTTPADIAQADEGVRAAYGAVLKQLVTILEADLGDRDEALALAALCVGGMVLARNVEGSPLAQAIRDAAYRQAQNMLKAAHADVRHTLRHDRLDRRGAHRAPG
jgi:TetR/AcrR family transcriptional regulator, transcriptional repressor for nem operon